LEEIEPLCSRFKPSEKVTASTGLRMQLISKEDISPGMPFEIYKGDFEELKKRFKKEMSESIQTSTQGIIAKADSLGSLEALLVLLKQQNIPVVKAGIGNINKKDVIYAKANLDINELDAIIVGFNVEQEEDLEIHKKIKIIANDVVYRLIEDLEDFRTKRKKQIEKKRLLGLTTICKLKILPEYVFRNTSPAIFGVRVEGGKLTSNLKMIDNENLKIGRIKNIQMDRKTVQEATEGQELAISIPGVNFERQIKNKEYLLTELGESQFKEFKKNKDLLSQNEIKILQDIAEIKRRETPEWGM
jgi:translation initiation factor 5B